MTEQGQEQQPRRRGDGVNRVTLIGRFAADPEFRVPQQEGGTQVCRLRLAVNASGEAEFFRLVAFGRLAEIIAEHGRKGRLVYIEGRLHNSQYSDKEGKPQTSTEVRVDEFQFLDPKPNGGSESQA